MSHVRTNTVIEYVNLKCPHSYRESRVQVDGHALSATAALYVYKAVVSLISQCNQFQQSL